MFLSRLVSLINVQIKLSNFLGISKIAWNPTTSTWKPIRTTKLERLIMYLPRKLLFIFYGIFLVLNNFRLSRYLDTPKFLRSSYWVLTYLGFSPIYLMNPQACTQMLNVLLHFETFQLNRSEDRENSKKSSGLLKLSQFWLIQMCLTSVGIPICVTVLKLLDPCMAPMLRSIYLSRGEVIQCNNLPPMGLTLGVIDSFEFLVWYWFASHAAFLVGTSYGTVLTSILAYVEALDKQGACSKKNSNKTRYKYKL